MTRKRSALAGLTAVALTALACPRPTLEPPADAPRLLLLLVVDQLGADHLVRFDRAFEGGLRRLLDQGTVYTEAHHAHAGTQTGPGHATVSTGCHPSRHGIISNYWIDRATGEEIYSAGDDSDARAPTYLECDALGDWLRESYPASRVFTVAGKDRSAVLLGGRRADGAYWYDSEGGFESSRYYRESAPEWLAEVNAEGLLGKHFGTVWTPLPVEPEALAEMGVAEFDLGPLEEDFPHPIGGLSLAPSDVYFADALDSPWVDESLLQVARRLITAEELGRDGYPDLLAIGFSTSDFIGHGHGPESREFFDILLRLDRELGAFFDWLDGTVGMDHVAIALTSDHGSVPVPERRIDEGLPARRVAVEEIACLQSLEAGLDQEFGEAQWLLPGPFFAPMSAGIEATAVEVRNRARSILEACPSVVRVWLAEELREETGSEMQRRFARSHFPARSPDLAIEWEEYFLASATSASSHGTPHRYDTHVPMVLWRPGGVAGSDSMPVRTVDIAPTLSEWAGVSPPAEIDGRSLARRPHPASNP